jgi:hypothetical protein
MAFAEADDVDTPTLTEEAVREACRTSRGKACIRKKAANNNASAGAEYRTDFINRWTISSLRIQIQIVTICVILYFVFRKSSMCFRFTGVRMKELKIIETDDMIDGIKQKQFCRMFIEVPLSG